MLALKFSRLILPPTWRTSSLQTAGTNNSKGKEAASSCYRSEITISTLWFKVSTARPFSGIQKFNSVDAMRRAYAGNWRRSLMACQGEKNMCSSIAAQGLSSKTRKCVDRRGNKLRSHDCACQKYSIRESLKSVDKGENPLFSFCKGFGNTPTLNWEAGVWSVLTFEMEKEKYNFTIYLRLIISVVP